VDVGSGTETLIGALVDTGFEVTGIDSSAELLPIARTHPTEGFLLPIFVEPDTDDAGLKFKRRPACLADVPSAP
jgi:2-polyprenyl-3-methyl-5-hydroxy-6-metoxy-1,4-benzoquinol methylase